MEKVVIECDNRFLNCLPYIKSRLEQHAKITHKKLRKCERIEVKGKDFIETLKDAIADVIVGDCKSHYIIENMKLPIRDEIDRHLFISALCEFDREVDKYLVSEILEITPTFVLGSFYDYRLGNLKRRWDEICLIANENIENLVVEGNFFELLRYLISNLEHRLDEVFLESVNGQIRVYDRQMQPVIGGYVNKTKSSQIQAMSILVANNPRRIFFWGEENEFFQKISGLFCGCIEISPGDELVQTHHA